MALLKDSLIKANWKGIKTDVIKSLPEWASDAPYQVRSLAIKEACSSVSRAKRKYKEVGTIQQVKFRSRKESKQSFYLPKSAVKAQSIFVEKLGKFVKTAEPIPKALFDGRVVYEYGNWWIVLPVDITVETPKTKEHIVSLDPGVRTFMTYYSLSGAGSIAHRAWERILGMCYRLDKMTSQLTRVKARRRQNIKRAMKRLRFRIKCLRDELHWKTAVWLAKTYNIIAIPEFKSQQMSKKHLRKIRSKTVRAMMSFGHYEFLTKLRYAASKYKSHIMNPTEAYTSKTCTVCGHIHETLGGRETFRCSECGLVISRDINGARNVLLRALVDSPATQVA